MQRIVGYVAVLSALTLFSASGALAANSVSLLWSGTSGTGATGGANIDASAGDTLTLDVVINIDTEGLSLFSLGISWTAGQLTGGATTECAGFVIPGSCVTSTFQTLSPLNPGVTVDNVAGTAVRWDAVDASAPYESIPQSLTVGTIVFTVNGTAAISTLYDPIFDGIADGLSNPTTFPAAAANVTVPVPEPGTMALLGLGLATLGAVGRRRS